MNLKLQFGRDGNDCYADLAFSRDCIGKTCPPRRRRVVAPHTEELALREVLGKPEYPLTKSLQTLCHGLPVLDIGAHVGSAAVYFEELLAPSQIICYEPNPVAVEYLQKNVPLATIHQAGVSNSAGTGEFFVRLPMFMSSIFQLQYEPDLDGMGEGPEKCIVPLVTGQDAINEIEGDIGILKIDAESAEVNIVRSMRGELDRVRVVFIEYHDEDARRELDVLLRAFHLFHCRTISAYDAWWGQGTVGYVHRKFLSHLKPQGATHGPGQEEQEIPRQGSAEESDARQEREGKESLLSTHR